MKQKIENFIKYATGQKEVSLLVTENEEEISELEKTFGEAGYKKAADAIDLMSLMGKENNLYLVVKSEDAKDDYDFAMQYPTGLVSIYDKEKMENLVANINYDNHSVLFLVTKHHLKELEKSNFDFLPLAGLIYRTEANHAS